MGVRIGDRCNWIVVCWPKLSLLRACCAGLLCDRGIRGPGECRATAQSIPQPSEACRPLSTFSVGLLAQPQPDGPRFKSFVAAHPFCTSPAALEPRQQIWRARYAQGRSGLLTLCVPVFRDPNDRKNMEGWGNGPGVCRRPRPDRPTVTSPQCCSHRVPAELCAMPSAPLLSLQGGVLKKVGDALASVGIKAPWKVRRPCALRKPSPVRWGTPLQPCDACWEHGLPPPRCCGIKASWRPLLRSACVCVCVRALRVRRAGSCSNPAAEPPPPLCAALAFAPNQCWHPLLLPLCCSTPAPCPALST